MRNFDSLQELKKCVGDEIGVSEWTVIEQSRIDMFAGATGDHNWVHVDRERAAAGPFGATIAHGFLTLSLLPLFTNNVIVVANVKLGLNYGLNKVRFPEPLRVGSRVRGRVVLLSMEDVAPIGGNPGYQIVFQVTVECEGRSKPACVAESVQRRYG